MTEQTPEPITLDVHDSALGVVATTTPEQETDNG